MNKQQKQIERFLTETFGADKGKQIFKAESENLQTMIDKTTGKSAKQMKTLTQVILPRIALYQAFSQCGEDGMGNMIAYMQNVVAASKHQAMASMEKIPFFFSLYRHCFLKTMRTTDLQVSTQKKGKDFFDVTITQCLWYTACVEHGCDELCMLFCDVDNATYGGLRKMDFKRTQTLGCGGTCCDFHFFKK